MTGASQGAAEFRFRFLGRHCGVRIDSPLPAATEIFERYCEDFPFYCAAPGSPVEHTVSITDVGGLAAELGPDDPVFADLRAYFARFYGVSDPAILVDVCTPRFVRTAAQRDLVRQALDQPDRYGLSWQRDFLVFSDLHAAEVHALADVASSVEEAYGYHVLNFFKIFFFRDGAVRFHGSSATHGPRAVVLLANTGGGKTTVKNLFLKAHPGPEPFTDDSILVMPTADGMLMYQDPVEFLKWSYLDRAEHAQHVIPKPREPVATAPTIYYLRKAEQTSWQACHGDEIHDLVSQEVFFQQGFLTRRFIPQPQQQRYLDQYYANSRRLLGQCRCHIVDIKHHDDYTELFAEINAALGAET